MSRNRHRARRLGLWLVAATSTASGAVHDRGDSKQPERCAPSLVPEVIVTGKEDCDAPRRKTLC